MSLETLVSSGPERVALAGGAEPNHTEVLKQLDRIVNSSLFRNSKRYPAFLRFIIENTLAGHTDLLKERTLGTEVFGRNSDYDTNADPVVRVTAGEIRKRLAQYYQLPEHETELRVDIPVGSYVPHFGPPHTYPHHFLPDHDPVISQDHAAVVDTQATEMPAAHVPGVAAATLGESLEPVAAAKPAAWKRFHLLPALGGLAAAGAVGVCLSVANNERQEAGSAFFWKPVLRADNPALIVIGVHSLGPDGRDLSPATYLGSNAKQDQSMLASMTSSDMVPVSDVISYSSIVQPLARAEHPFRTQGAAATTFEQLQHGPLILIGGLDNVWTLRLTSALRFRFVEQEGSIGAIQDRNHPGTTWRFDNAQRALSNSRDYAIVASFLDPQIEQHVLISAGIGKSGTAAAANFLTNRQYLHDWLQRAQLAGHKNVELVLSTEMVEGQPGPPHIIAEDTW